MPLTGLSPPSKGFFAPSSMPTSRSDASSNAGISSAVPSHGRRRESITGQMRRKATDTASAAGAGGASGLSMSRAAAGAPGSPTGRAIPMMARSPRRGMAEMGGGLSTSFGAAAEALSLSSSITSNSTVAPGSFQARSSAQPIKHEGRSQGRSQGHSHLGVECFGPSSLDSTMPMPSPGMIANGSKRDRRSSVSSTGTVGEEDDDDGKSSKGGKHEELHRCESCAKVYRHPSCLIKHRWEHTVYWKEASKFLMSKHQQVQLLEAAAILVGMDANARSLPEEKALWPAAVSPPSSGLLGSESINFETLMASKRRNTISSNASNASSGSPARRTTPSLVPNDSSDGSTTSMYDPSMRSVTMSPLAGLGNMRLTESNGRHRDVGRYRLDDSASGSGSDRADRSGSAEMYDDEDVDDEARLDDDGEERYGADAGGDVMAHMEMDDVN
ncbi:uncharacterized protein SPSC_03359 [Sporisorium scitamineum]|uniref:C2H2-type domain-containing protein n=1 Tax=Sporisorium scitamineum TaxID=49012 RepID=A0A127ZDU5_9BASI|nr:uncharacterized protein SPSC_03359 [Sporisorium scitamineum]